MRCDLRPFPLRDNSLSTGLFSRGGREREGGKGRWRERGHRLRGEGGGGGGATSILWTAAV